MVGGCSGDGVGVMKGWKYKRGGPGRFFYFYFIYFLNFFCGNFFFKKDKDTKKLISRLRGILQGRYTTDPCHYCIISVDAMHYC